jgi:DNA-directed RNA polymerase specialized sigma24 family protein
MLIEGYGWTFGEVAALLGLSRGAVETHVRRGLRKLREALEVTLDA